MKLSVIIVNFNVREFLAQCLHSVQKAMVGIDGEVWVVDNASSDGSVETLKPIFPDVNWIESSDNLGFSKGNNLAIHRAKGEFILLLNPDTVVGENSFHRSIEFLERDPQRGALGIRMIDGGGHYLPESKRGLPTPMVAFYKIFGLTRLFPRSKTFARYYMGHLDPDHNHEVDVMAGAYMIIRKEALDKVGLLDETFFMYGEDIDLSYRIQKGGYTVHYLAESTILHYKGESTKRGSLNYVWVFYRAMVLFAKKHFTRRYSALYSTVIYLAIYFRMAAGMTFRLLRTIAPPMVDLGLIYLGFYVIKTYWENNHRFIEGGQYPDVYHLWFMPAYIVIWLISVGFFGGYRKPIRIPRLVSGMIIGTILMLVVYSMLPEIYRFSRALIILGAIWATFYLVFSRLTLIMLFSGRSTLFGPIHRRTALLVSSEREMGFKAFLKDCDLHRLVVLTLSPDLTKDEIRERLRVMDIGEIWIHPEDIGYDQVLRVMQQIDGNLRFKLFNPVRETLIGSDSIRQRGTTLVKRNLPIGNKEVRDRKRRFDIAVCFTLIPLVPLWVIAPRKMGRILRNWPQVLSGKRSWVGYSGDGAGLPSIPKGVIPTTIHKVDKKDLSDKADMAYAENYDINLDLYYLLKFLQE
ncbi:MAG: glycosyltransferase [Bacteroidota bacterium]|nr:glycosyltransferase [Bacteroidota bacterium]